MISLKHGAQDALAAIEIDREARRLQREADAALVEAAGCLGPSFCGQITHHDPRCPIALAEQLRSGG